MFDVDRGGDRFVMPGNLREEVAAISAILNWTQLVKRPRFEDECPAAAHVAAPGLHRRSRCLRKTLPGRRVVRTKTREAVARPGVRRAYSVPVTFRRAFTLDLAPLVALKKAVSRAAFFSGLTIYLEACVTLVFLTQGVVAPWATLPLVLLLVAQLAVVWRPAQLLMAEQLARSYRMQWLLAAAYIAAVAMSASHGETRAAATLMAVLATSLPAWPVVTATRTAVRLRTHIPHGVDSRVLVGCLSFNPRQAIAVRLRALGGMRVRWAAPLIAGGLALVGTLMLLGFLLQRLGVDTGAGVGPVSAVVAAWAFYRTLRHTKLTAAAVRAHDARPPVLILRRFTDDVLGKARLDASTFEHALAADLNRIGPTVAIGRPGERLQPLGAARDYPSSDWQGTVRALMQEAELVVFLLATSENLNWEFKTAMAARGLARVLVLAPPMARADVEQRWIAFVDATADVLPTTLRQTLPDQRLLAVLFAGEEAVSIVVSGTALRQSMVARSWPEYRLVIRIRESLRPEDLASINALEAFLRQHLPFVTLSASPVP